MKPLERTNAYLRKQGLDFRLRWSQSRERGIIILERRRPYGESFRESWQAEFGDKLLTSRYSFGRFHVSDLKTAFLDPQPNGDVGRRSMGWQNYPDSYVEAFDEPMDFAPPRVTAEQAREIMDLILLDKLSR